MFPDREDPQGGGYQGNRSRRDFPIQESTAGVQLIGGDASRRNHSLYYRYHQDKGHTTEDCRTLHDHLNQLVRAGKLNQFLHQPVGQFGHFGAKLHRGNVPQPALGAINVIFSKPRANLGTCSRVMFVGGGPDVEAVEARSHVAKKAKRMTIPILDFSKEDKVGTCQLHDDTLVVIIRIGGYDLKRVLVDQGSRAKIMYCDLHNGLNLKPKDLERYDSPLVGFDGKVVVPQGMIKLLIQVGGKEVQVNFIVVKAYFPYTTILVKPWLHALGAVSLTLHMKVNYPTHGRVEELLDSQAMARQCLVSAITQPPEDPSVEARGETP
ncbi:uncharacterized protein LOC142612212 [Castanea sativa]|uniref:uncharacterized protein LOC142612212 n=1 Tax=Castanea sativa TaxID=21020 RepID=UPI003F64AE9C